MGLPIQIPSWPQAGEREAELLRLVLESPHWGGFHPFVAEFEQSFAAYQHSAFGISAFNGTVTLEAALTVLGIGQSDEVIVPAISFIATASAVSRMGAVPVFVDIGADSFNIDPERVREAITPRTKAVICVHFGGAMCDMEAIEDICREHGLILLEDAAHAQGSEWNGKRAGSFGIAWLIQFSEWKGANGRRGRHAGEFRREVCEPRFAPWLTAGEFRAGASTSIRTWAQIFGMTAFQAAVLIAQFERLPEQIVTRTANAQLLKRHLDRTREITWQKQPAKSTQNSFYLLVGRTENPEARDRLCRALATAGVPCTPFYPHPLYRNELYRRTECRMMPCPVAEARIRDAFWLPHRLLLADRDVMEEVAGLICQSCR